MVWGSRGSRGSRGSQDSQMQVDRKNEMVWFSEGKEIHISDVCIASTMDSKCYDVNIMKSLELLFESFLEMENY